MNPAVALELTRQILVAIAEEMGTVLRRTAFSPNIKERRDYSCAVYGRDGGTIAMGDHMPVHLGAMPLSVMHVRQALRLRRGDVAIVNDPFAGGTHLPDITAVSGVFPGGAATPEFYVASRAHHADVGGMSAGSMPVASEIYQAGLRIPPILLVREGAIDKGLCRLILANVRTPEERAGDLRAQLVSLKLGEERLMTLAAKQGVARLRRGTEALAAFSERMMRAEIERLPDGDYRFEDQLDGGIRIRVMVTIEGSSARVDFTGSSPQQPGPVNANYAIALAATMYVFRCLIEEEVPFTAGLLRPVTVIAPEGSVVNARPPAAMAAGNVETSQRITDVLLGALAQAAPGRIPAGSCGTMSNVSFGGTRDGQPFAYYETIAGGMGASPRGPGLSGRHTHMTNSWNTPVEAFEHSYPVRIRRYSLRRGSGGAGRHQSGDGIVREFEFLAPAEFTLLADRRDSTPYGLAGGSPGAAGQAFRDGGALPGKTRFAAEPGTVVRIESPGGGGYGSTSRSAESRPRSGRKPR
jgi:N-methylhydantoinase B/oxoprolinase/acetone carboxylase alpha subunit